MLIDIVRYYDLFFSCHGGGTSAILKKEGPPFLQEIAGQARYDD